MTNAEPFVAYHANPEWITNFLQGEKISMEVARREYIRCVKGCENNLRNLACLERLAEEHRIKRLEASVKRALAPTYHPNRSYPEVERFLEEHQVLKDRYKFLVLSGPSGMGKTQFVRNLCREENAILELNCAGSMDLDLKDFSRTQHDVVLFDEASPACVIKHKKLFQCPPCLVTLGQSATAMYTYKVWVHQKLFVVCANGWHEQMAKMPAADIEWLQKNSHVVMVSAPMWMS